MVLKTWEVVYKFHHLGGLFLVALVASAFYINQDMNLNIDKVQVASVEEQALQVYSRKSISHCEIHLGKWVYDNVSYPLYKERQCSFIEEAFACEMQERKDLKYQKWRWQPHQCDLPRFNGKAFLEKIRGKKLVFVGDSVNRNQWQSMLCLLESSLSSSSNKSTTLVGNTYVFHADEYNATIEFYWSPLLVDSNGDDPLRHSGLKREVRIESIEKHAWYWSLADILIFNSFAWWTDPNFTLVWGSFGSSDAIIKKVQMTQRLYEMALKTWSDWLEININRTKTKLFFMSNSPIHSNAKHWGGKEGNCYGSTEQIIDEEVQWGLLMQRRLMKIAESIIDDLKIKGLKVQYINMTELSAYRKDAHPSVYGAYPIPRRNRKPGADKFWMSDCLHWCLPGVPDVWNQILYAYIMDS